MSKLKYEPIKADPSECIDYFFENVDRDSVIYVVWKLGPTDGWPHAIFYSEKDAKDYAERNDTLEGVSVLEHNFFDFIKALYNELVIVIGSAGNSRSTRNPLTEEYTHYVRKS